MPFCNKPFHQKWISRTRGDLVDLAVEPTTGKKVFLLAQSYMPAQEIHILRNANNDKITPWHEVNGDDKLYTPEWTFEWPELRRFHERE